MQIYLVGGAIRDRLLHRPVTERDWLVVGATPEQMLAQGFRQVGQDFPVFLHPDTQEEYALARTERKVGPGYRGFQFSAEQVSLEQDLARRDLTINAIAEDAQGQLLDPYQGLADLNARILRHVSPAFSEDPVRILRLARFAARYSPLGFRIAPDTLALCQTMVQNGEVAHLTPERVWQEFERALGEPEPVRFIDTLKRVGALAVILPELDALFGVPNPPRWHPEVCSGVHSLLSLHQASRLSPNPRVRFAALLHDLGKSQTDASHWPSHPGHESMALALIQRLCQRLKVPNEFRALALHTAQYHSHCHRIDELKASTQLKLVQALDGLRRPERIEEFVLACEADARARPGFDQREYGQAKRLRQIQAAAQAVTAAPLLAQGYQGAALGEQLERARLQAIKALPPLS